MSGKVVRLGCGSGFWGDTAEGPLQLVKSGQIDYLVMDYLAEITMSLLERRRKRNPEHGYVADFVTHVISPLAGEIAERKVKVVVNAGGVNPRACRDHVVQELTRQGVPLKVAVITGDDVSALIPELRTEGVREMASGRSLPESVLGANAYLGGFPIAAALAEGADIVITGRCADSALALGPLVYEFGWQPDDHDRLAAGSLAGHVIECGPQSTGGIFTDWQKVADSWAAIGFPIAECHEDGRFVVTKPRGSGGLVTWGTVAEQVAYEVGDPRNYVLPDVVCDFSEVQLEQIETDRVLVTGAKGKAPTNTYKVSATYPDGYRSIATLLVKGVDAVPKARAVAAAILKRTRAVFERGNLGDYADTSVEVLGAEDTYGPHAHMTANREVVLKIGVRHADRQAVELFSREIAPASTGMAQGIAGIAGGRPAVQPVVRLFSFLVEKARLAITLECEGKTIDVPVRTEGEALPESASSNFVAGCDESDLVGDTVNVPLVAVAYGRSGDKGDLSNIAVLARHPRFLPVIASQLTQEAVAQYLAHIVEGPVERYSWPGLRGFNFLLHQSLGGGGVASLRYDPQGKGHAQMLMDFPIKLPSNWLSEGQVDPI